MIELNDDERRYLALKCADHTDDEISEIMGRSAFHIRHVSRRIRSKFGSRTIRSCIVMAMNAGMIPIENGDAQ